MCGIWVSTHKLPTEISEQKEEKTITRLHTPKGTKDILPNEIKQYHYLEDKLKETFELWNYKEVRSPTIEFVETLSTGVGPELVDAMFKFQDSDGKLLALRAEMTGPVARIVTTKMQSTPEPIRLFPRRAIRCLTPCARSGWKSAGPSARSVGSSERYWGGRNRRGSRMAPWWCWCPTLPSGKGWSGPARP